MRMEEDGRVAMDRRHFLVGALGVAGAAALAGCSPQGAGTSTAATGQEDGGDAGKAADDLGDPVATYDCDVLVVGTGTAGMVAAVQAVELGARTMVIEKVGFIGGQSSSAEVMFGCNSRLQREQNLAYTDFELLTHECEFHNFRVDRELWTRIIEVSGNSIDWLLDNVEPYGAGFQMVLGGIDAPQVAHMFGAYSDDEGDWEKGAGISHALNKVLIENGIEVMTSCEARQLISEGERVVGLYAEAKEGLIRINAAKGVILACGGFTGSPEMITEMGRNADRMMCRGFPTNVGDGIRMAREVGADHRGAMNAQLMGPTMPFESSNDYKYVTAVAVLLGSPLWVNHHGIRFVKEAGLIYTVTSNAIDMQDDVYTVFDQALVNASQEIETGIELATYFPPGTKLDQVQAEIDDLLGKGVDYAFSGDTIEELAQAMGVDAANLKASVDRYNELCDAGKDEDFDKDPAMLAPIKEGPFYAFRVYNNLLCTGGGVRINRDAQVLRPGAVPIEGLYCAGQDCDGFMGETYGVNLPGSTQGIALCTGRLAACHACGQPL